MFFLIGHILPVCSLFQKSSILKNLIQMALIDFGVLFPLFIGRVRPVHSLFEKRCNAAIAP